MNHTFEITKSEREAARAYQNKMDELFPPEQKTNYTGLAELLRWYNGRLAEIVFQKFLNANGIIYANLTNDDGRADNGDFLIWNNDLVDTKFVPYYGTKFLYSISQWKRYYERGVIISHFAPIKINHWEISGTVLGYYTRREVFEMRREKIKIFSFVDEYINSRPVDELLKHWETPQNDLFT